MAFYAQLKDGVCFAYVESETYVEGSILLENEINPDSILAHKYVNGVWSPAELIHFAEKINNQYIIEKTNSTVFSSDVVGEIIPPHVGVGWKKENNEWFNYQEFLREESERNYLQNQENLIQERINEIISTRPFPSWNLIDMGWEPPVPRPNDGQEYYWNEELLAWEPIIDSQEVINEINN